MADVVLRNVSKKYESGNFAAKDINLEIKDREFVVLVGPSGCGKSTTLRMIAGLEEITAGELLIDNIVVNEVPPKDRDIAMVFQNYALYPHMTVYENMAFGLKLRKFSKAEIDRRVKEAAALLGLEEFLQRKPKALSGGQRQRVAVGRAIVRKPKVFLFDEPLSNLDAKLRVQTRAQISKLHKSLNATMIYVTHDQIEAMTMGDRIVVMKDGVIQQIDKPLNLYNYPENKFVAGFIGSPAMNFISGELYQDGGIKFISSAKSFSLPIPALFSDKLNGALNKKVCLGIRPEDIRESADGEDRQLMRETPVTIELVEPMGNEIFIYFDIEGVQFTSRISARNQPRPGDKINLFINAAKLHFFLEGTEESLF